MAKLENVEVMWACVHEVNEMSGKYQIDAVNLSPKQAKAFKDAGVTVTTCDRDENNRGKFVTLKSTKPVKVVDMGKNEITDLIGNGSICNIAWNPFDWKFKGKSGTSAGLQALQVKDLVSYAGGVDEFDAEEESGARNVDFNPDDEIPF